MPPNEADTRAQLIDTNMLAEMEQGILAQAFRGEL